MGCVDQVLGHGTVNAGQADVQTGGDSEACGNWTNVHAGVDGRIEQFTLRVGDIVNPFMRPGGVLIPNRDGTTLVADPRAPRAKDLDFGGDASVLMVTPP